MLDGHSAVQWQGNVFVWGGKDEAPPTGNRPGHSFYSNTMYMMSCLEAIQPTAQSITLERLTISPQQGSHVSGQQLVAAPKGRAYHTASLYGKYMFIIGGLMDESSSVTAMQRDESNNNVVVPVFDLEARSWSFRNTFGDIPCARCHHVAAVYGDIIMVHGGYPILPGGQQRELTAEEMASMQHAMFDVYELTVTTMRWRRISTTQSPALWGHTALAFNKNVIVFGGVDVVENTETSAVAVWHQEKKLWRWADFQNLELRCAMHTAVQEGNRMLIFGGVSFRNQKKLRTLYEFNLEFGTWREVPTRGHIPTGRIGHAAVTFQQHMIVIGGSAESPTASGDGEQNLASAPTKFDRKVYVFNTQNNEWRSLTVSNSDSNDTEQSQRTPVNTSAWSINKSVAGRSEAQLVDDATGQPEWDSTANRVRETLSKAKAIQQLADTATGTLLNGPQTTDSNSPRRQGYAAVGPSEQPGPPSAIQVVGGNEEARRVIDHLAKENDSLRQQLEEFRQLSLTGHQRNPYEVPMFNTSAAVLPENDSLASPGRAKGAARLDGNNALSDLAPRLNINVADPPRAVGSSGSAAPGYMSRGAVSALVSSSLRDQPASISLAANLRAAASLDPRSYLTQTPAVASYQSVERPTAFNGLGAYQPPQSYEQLLNRNGFNGGGSFNIPSTTDMPPVPTSLKPLLAILTGGSSSYAPGPSQNSQQSPFQHSANGYGQQQQQYGQAQQQQQYQSFNGQQQQYLPPSSVMQQFGASHMAAMSQNSMAGQALDTSLNGSGSVQRQRGTPSLNRIVSGQGSMLSLSLLK